MHVCKHTGHFIVVARYPFAIVSVTMPIPLSVSGPRFDSVESFFLCNLLIPPPLSFSYTLSPWVQSLADHFPSITFSFLPFFSPYLHFFPHFCPHFFLSSPPAFLLFFFLLLFSHSFYFFFSSCFLFFFPFLLLFFLSFLLLFFLLISFSSIFLIVFFSFTPFSFFLVHFFAKGAAPNACPTPHYSKKSWGEHSDTYIYAICYACGSSSHWAGED